MKTDTHAGEPRQFADGLWWISRGDGTDDHLGYGQHEAVLEPTMAELLPDNGVFLDIGAHVGRWSLRLARKAGRVIAVEPNPDAAKVLRSNVEVNGLTNIEVWEYAAWDCAELLVLEDPNGFSGGGSTHCRSALGGTAQGVRLDDHLGDVDRVDLVKLDVEGADIRALNGMADSLLRLSPTLLIETHYVFGYYTREELLNLLTRLNYSWRPAPSFLGVEYLIAEKENQ